MRLLILMLLLSASTELTGNEVVEPIKQTHSVLLKHIPIKPKYFNVRDIQCTAETIYSEARGEPLVGKHAVGYTIVNRSTKILHKRPCSVVKQQYTQKRLPNKDRMVFLTLAENVLDGKVPNPIGNLDSFDSFPNKPHKRGSIHIGNHFFYKAIKT
jgi:hypothetical protein